MSYDSATRIGRAGRYVEANAGMLGVASNMLGGMQAAGKRRLRRLIIAGGVVALWIGLATFTRLTYAPRPEPERLGTTIDAPYQVLQFADVTSSAFHWPLDSGYTVQAEFAMPDGGIVHSTSRLNLIGRDWLDDYWAGPTTAEYPNAVRTVDFLFDYEGTSYHYQVDVFFRFNPAIRDTGPYKPFGTSPGNAVTVSSLVRQIPSDGSAGRPPVSPLATCSAVSSVRG